MGTTRLLARPLISQAVGGYHTDATTSAGSAGGTTAVCSRLAKFPDDWFNGWWLVLPNGPSGAGSYTAEQVSDFTQSTGTITLAAAVGAPTEIATSNTFELHYNDPTDLHNALNRAAEMLYPSLYLPIRDESLMIDQRLVNGGFESTVSGGAHPSWTNAGAGVTVTGDTSIVWHGSQSAKIVAGGGAAGQMYQAITPALLEVTGDDIKLKSKVYATAADTARIGVSFDGGSTYTYSDYHSGADQWETLSIDTTVPSTASSIRAYLEVAASGTGYFDAAWCKVGSLYRYTVPSTIITGPHFVSQVVDPDRPDGPYYAFGQQPFAAYHQPSEGYRLRLEGMGYLTRPTADTGSFEVDGARLDLLIARAAEWFFAQERASRRLNDAQREKAEEEVKHWRDEVERLLRQPGVRMPTMPAEVPDGWHIDEADGSRVLVFSNSRG